MAYITIPLKEIRAKKSNTKERMSDLFYDYKKRLNTNILWQSLGKPLQIQILSRTYTYFTQKYLKQYLQSPFNSPKLTSDIITSSSAQYLLRDSAHKLHLNFSAYLHQANNSSCCYPNSPASFSLDTPDDGTFFLNRLMKKNFYDEVQDCRETLVFKLCYNLIQHC